MFTQLLIAALLQNAPIVVKEPLVAGLAHDRQMVRQTSEILLSRLLNHRGGGLKGFLESKYENTADAEVRLRLRRVLAQYENVFPVGKSTFPRIDSLEGPLKDIGLPEDIDARLHLGVFTGYARTFHSLAKGAEIDTYLRMMQQNYIRELIRLGADRWKIQRKLDRLFRDEEELNIKPAKPVLVLEPE